MDKCVNKNDLISVIVPVYNMEQYMERCVNSIINQTYHNLEIILVDDGSTDHSTAMCDESTHCVTSGSKSYTNPMADYQMPGMQVWQLSVEIMSVMLTVTTG